ncbi:PREDICTED: centaurin-gamma-1A-like [Chaetura pelagica]|uniref:centaurin-gamma-1A-like n=1 Tax=Chaetura pelagica TaxID=8897 RepID=UPI000523EA41|nr:PREDICTED: centaurin-gamma-1A-like [Chaetura pelagica]
MPGICLGVQDVLPPPRKVKDSEFVRSGCFWYSDSFVNSQEWTLSRSVPELKVGCHPQLQHPNL